MTKDELEFELRSIENLATKKKNAAIKAYCIANNPYKVGDTFTDHMGSVRVEKIYISLYDRCCAYYGVMLNKDGSANKRGAKRKAYQFNQKAI